MRNDHVNQKELDKLIKMIDEEEKKGYSPE